MAKALAEAAAKAQAEAATKAQAVAAATTLPQSAAKEQTEETAGKEVADATAFQKDEADLPLLNEVFSAATRYRRLQAISRPFRCWQKLRSQITARQRADG